MKIQNVLAMLFLLAIANIAWANSAQDTIIEVPNGVVFDTYGPEKRACLYTVEGDYYHICEDGIYLKINNLFFVKDGKIVDIQNRWEYQSRSANGIIIKPCQEMVFRRCRTVPGIPPAEEICDPYNKKK